MGFKGEHIVAGENSGEAITRSFGSDSVNGIPKRVPVVSPNRVADSILQMPSRVHIRPAELVDPVMIPPTSAHFPLTPPEGIAHMYEHLHSDLEGAVKKQGKGGEVERTAAQLRVLYLVAGGDPEHFDEMVSSFHGKGRPSAQAIQTVADIAEQYETLKGYERADLDPLVQGSKRATGFAEEVGNDSANRQFAVAAALDTLTSAMPVKEGVSDHVADAKAHISAIDGLVTVLAHQAERDGDSVLSILQEVFNASGTDRLDVSRRMRHLEAALEEYAHSPEAERYPKLYVKDKDTKYAPPAVGEGLVDIVSDTHEHLLVQGRPKPITSQRPKEQWSERPKLTPEQLRQKQGGYGQVWRYAGSRDYY